MTMQYRIFALTIVLLTISASSGSTRAAPGDAPVIQSPANGARLQSFGTELTWANPAGTTQNYIEIIPSPWTQDGAPDGPAITLVRNAAKSFPIDPPQMGAGNYVMLPDMTYTWRVRATSKLVFAPPEDSEWSPPAERTFRTPIATSQGIAPVQPLNEAPVESLTPVLQWSHTNTSVFYYEIQLSKDPSFNTGTVPSSVPLYWELVHGGVTNPLNSYQVRAEFALDASSQYFWRVRPRVQGDGTPVAWSDAFRFTTPGGGGNVELDPVFTNVVPQGATTLVQVNDGTGRFFVTEQDGIVKMFTSGSAATVFLDIRSKVLTDNNEEGLLGLAFDPNYSSNGRFYVYYSRGNPRRNVVARFNVSADPNQADANSEVVLLESPKPFGNHNGGQLMFGPDGYLYIGIGDGGGAGDPQRNGQNVGTILGKVLRIDVRGDSYEIPGDNPFVGVGRGEVWAYGLRNPWRFSFDRVTGELWLADVGQNQYEEIDRIDKGGNYGWNIMEGFHCYNASSCNQSGLTPPVTEYDHSRGECSVTGGFVYRGNQVPALRGNYIYADFCTGRIWRYDGSVTELMNTNHQITTFAEDTQGELYIVARNSGIHKFVQR